MKADLAAINVHFDLNLKTDFAPNKLPYSATDSSMTCHTESSHLGWRLDPFRPPFHSRIQDRFGHEIPHQNEGNLLPRIKDRLGMKLCRCITKSVAISAYKIHKIDHELLNRLLTNSNKIKRVVFHQRNCVYYIWFKPKLRHQLAHIRQDFTVFLDLH